MKRDNCISEKIVPLKSCEIRFLVSFIGGAFYPQASDIKEAGWSTIYPSGLA